MVDWENKIKKYTVPAYEKAQVTKTILSAEDALRCAGKQNLLTGKKFVFAQVQFIRKRMWLLQLGSLLGIYSVVTAMCQQDFMTKQILPTSFNVCGQRWATNTN